MTRRSDSLEDIVSEYSPRLYGYIRSRVDNPQDAEDILQDVFYQLARSSAEGLTAIERISSWLYRVANNSVVNFIRKKRESTYESYDEICDSIAETLFCGPQDAPDTAFLRTLIWQELDMALAELPPEQSEVFCLTVFDGLSVKDIAEATQTPEATLRSRKHYAVRHLRKRFYDLYNELMIRG